MKVLVTGAAGRIGTNFYKGLAGKYTFRLADLSDKVLSMPTQPGDEAIILDIADADACMKACQGVDAVLHLAAQPNPFAELDDLMRNNIQGTVNIFQGALAESQCTRVVFASSVWAMKGYEGYGYFDTDLASKPTNLYGASKVFGEGWSAAFAHSAPGRSAVAIRIGAYDADWMKEDFANEWDFAAYVSHRDLNQLIDLTLTKPINGYAVVHGVSKNRRMILASRRTTELLGYQPVDDGYDVFARLHPEKYRIATELQKPQ